MILLTREERKKRGGGGPPFVHNTDESFCGGCYTSPDVDRIYKRLPIFRVYGLTEKKELLSTPLREKASHQSTSKRRRFVCRVVWCMRSPRSGVASSSLSPRGQPSSFSSFFRDAATPTAAETKTGKNRYHRRRKSRLVIRGGGVEETGRTTREADDAMRKASSVEATTTTTTSSSSGGDEDDETNTVFSTKPSLLGKLGQSMNVAGISLFLKLAVSDASLAVPHVDCESIQDIDWFKLKQAGFTAVIFDKDNTLTIPYATDVYPPLLESVKECTQAFGNERVCVYSNSAGLEQYDPNGMEAKHLEKELGIRVARHKEKKPSGSGAELAKFLNNDSHSKKESSNSRGETNSPCEKFVFVGDRYLTDVVFGNKSGMFTIRVAPFDVSNESKAIAAARSIESYFLRRWRTKNKTKPTPHALDERTSDQESVYLKTNGARSWRE